ncbi:TolC family protein [Haliovirga abyssi]|uniref:TolC family protein n=1 Tax=Haliovirga abyssi TaxID=2996794 RepID=A0AAU9D5E9_9FUSO|nr:TolC family protein [Haliovirga abyssi]BDU51199.1 hypothetical protein HLVA_17680 [Haliovirga abyssi]
MKKIVLVIMILISVNIFAAKKLGLDDIIESFNNKSSYVKKEKLELDKLKIDENGNFIDKWGKLSFNITPNYSYYTDKDKMPLNLQMTKDISKYPGGITVNLGYNMFYSAITYDNTTSKVKRVSYKLGLTKSLNDIIYSEQKYKDNSINLNSKLTKLNLKISKKTELKNIVDLYIRIKNLDSEILINENSLKVMNEEYENLIKKLEYGEAVKIDVEYMGIEIKSIKNSIEYLKKEIKNKKRELLKKVGIEDSDYEFKDIKAIDNFKIEINEDKIVVNSLNEKLNEENLKYYKRKSEPNINFDMNYDIEGKVWNAGIVFTGNIIEYGTDVRKTKKELDKLKIEKKELEIKSKEDKENAEIEYKNLLSKLEIAKEKMQNMEKRYEVDKNIYENGYMSLLDFLKEQKNRDEAKLNYDKAKNELNGFRYKVKRDEIKG